MNNKSKNINKEKPLISKEGFYLWDSKIAALVFRIITLGFSIFGISIMFSFYGIGKQLVYFTNQTNLFILILFSILTIGQIVDLIIKKKKGHPFNIFMPLQLALVFYISITFLVYWTMLSWQGFEMGGDNPSLKVLMQFANYTVHGIVPLLAILDWILFSKHGVIKYRYGFIWLSYIYVYLIFILIRAQVGGPLSTKPTISYYPYPFIDLDAIGPLYFTLVVIGLSLGFLGLGLLFIFLDKLIAKRIALRKIKIKEINVVENKIEE